MVRAPGRKIRVEAVAHHGNGIGLSAEYGKLCHHCLCFGKLVLTAVRHQHAACADGGVEHLHQTLLGADIQVAHKCQPCALYIFVLNFFFYFINCNPVKIIVFFGRNVHGNFGFLMGAVGIQESTG